MRAIPNTRRLVRPPGARADAALFRFSALWAAAMWAAPFMLLGTAELWAAPADRVADIKLPPGFSISVFAEVPGARNIAITPNSKVLLVTDRVHSLFAVVDENGDFKADTIHTLQKDLNAPTRSGRTGSCSGGRSRPACRIVDATERARSPSARTTASIWQSACRATSACPRTITTRF